MHALFWLLVSGLSLLFLGALVTLIGAWLIARAHPRRGRRIDIDGSCQHVVELGPSDGSAGALPLVLLHGAGCNLEDLRLALGERLSPRHRVILIDRPGQGWSESGGRKFSSPAAQAAMLREIFDRFGVARALLVGHSWGGALALAFALDHPPRAAGLVLLAPPTHPHLRRLTRLYRMLAAPLAGRLFAHTLALPLAAAAFASGIGTAFAPQTPPRHYLKRSAAFLLLRPAAFLANARDMADLQAFLARQAPRYRELAAPTIIIQGDGDAIVPIEQHAMALAAAAPQAKLVVLPGIGHMPHHAAADRVVAEIEDLVRMANSE
jgi:pimeloyl-ACP methyl ester carboxylesterase